VNENHTSGPPQLDALAVAPTVVPVTGTVVVASENTVAVAHSSLAVDEHEPLLQCCGLVHALPHVPQFESSLARLTQLVPHAVAPPGHTQVEDVHVAVDGHTVPHAPQLFMSLFTSTHAPPHSTRPVEQ
jgi:hypothetical protein